MRIDAFLHASPMFAVNRAARRFEALTARVLAADSLGFLEGLVLAAMFFESPRLIKPSQGKRCALRVIGAFDKLQKDFEEEIGKTALSEMLKAIRKLEAMFAAR